MADDKTNGFSHISVGGESFDDDDIVIVAGTRSAKVEEPASNLDRVAEQEGSPVPEQQVDAIQEEALDAAEAEVEDAVPEDVHPAAKEAYHETTLEDLESSRMPAVQKVVIAIAIVLVLIVAWYILH